MRLKALTFGTLAASTVIFASMVISPAEAATVTGTLEFSKFGSVNSITGSGVDLVKTPNFFSVADSSNGTFEGLRGKGITILNDITFPTSPSFSPFDFLKVDNGGTGITFSVTGFGPNFLQGPNYVAGTLLGNFRLDGDITLAKSDSFGFAFLSPTGSSVAGFSIGSTGMRVVPTPPTPVPTPALLPGLVGMGIAALRKRKSAELETADA